MNESDVLQTRGARGREDIVIVLLLVQSVVGLVGLLGMLVIGLVAGFPLVTLAGVIVVAGFVVPLVLAIGVARGHRRARQATIVYESIALISVGLNLLLALSPDVQMDLSLSGLLTMVVLPVAVIGVLNGAPAVVVAPASPTEPKEGTAATTVRQVAAPAVGG